MDQGMTRRAAMATARTASVAVILTALTISGALAGPKGGPKPPHNNDLTRSDIQTILNQGETAANHTTSADGFRSNTQADRGPLVERTTKMHIAVVARDGLFLDIRSMPDAWVGSVDIAIAKARTAAFFSSDENALTSRIIGVASQPHTGDPQGDSAGPLWGIGDSNQVGITGGPMYRNGIITFPGGIPLYKNGKLVGGVGVSGDAVDQDEAVAFAAAAGFEPGPSVVRLGWPKP